MNPRSFLSLVAAVTALAQATVCAAAPPVAVNPLLVVELVAQEPDLVTPTGVAVDERGRIWVIENHTHQRPGNYKGPAGDRIRVFEDFAPDGKARKVTTFAEGLRDTMGIALGKNGAVYVATRSTIYLFRDTKGNGRANEKTVLARLDTKADYPHNGLSGFAIDALGDLHFGLGENFGAAYSLVGSDDKTLDGGGEGGSIYRMHADGTGLTRLATGFWNPFHMAFDRWGRLFAVDNDPDARGPCRLLHIVPGGDYGYRFKYGRKGIHPFQSWNGELPGTLPMVAGTAEAPSGIVAYESDGLPGEYRGCLLVTSWGDHVIEQFDLLARGASFGAKKKVMVRGGEDFRPVGIALAPDGSVIVSDWVDRSYPVHGKGRLWRIRMKQPRADMPLSVADLKNYETSKLQEMLGHPRREVRLAAAELLAGRAKTPGEFLVPILRGDGKPPALARLHALWSLAEATPIPARALAMALGDPSPEVRAEAAALARGQSRKIVEPMLQIITDMAMKDPSPLTRLQAILTAGKFSSFSADRPHVDLLADPDPFTATAALEAVAKKDSVRLISYLADASPRLRVGILLALRRDAVTEPLPRLLEDSDPGVRRAAIQWVAEENLIPYANLLDKAATREPVSREVFEAWLAAQELLANPKSTKDPVKESSGEVFMLKVLKDAKRPAALRALALHMLRPTDAGLQLSELLMLAKHDDKNLRTEALKALAWRSEPAAQALLRDVAGDESQSLALRADAVLGLAHSAAKDGQTRQLLLQLAEQRRACVSDALRSLRGALTPADAKFFDPWWKSVIGDPALTKNDIQELAEQALLALGQSLAIQGKNQAGIALHKERPQTVEAWRDFLLAAEGKGEGDAAAGERVFFHAKGARCFACHRIDGRGEAIGPDLSHIGAAMTRAKLIESILEPSKEIAPAFVTWLVTTRDGKQHAGVLVGEGFDSTLTLADATGKRTVLKITDVEERVAQTTSIMPADLHGKMTQREFRDLLAFLESRK